MYEPPAPATPVNLLRNTAINAFTGPTGRKSKRFAQNCFPSNDVLIVLTAVAAVSSSRARADDLPAKSSSVPINSFTAIRTKFPLPALFAVVTYYTRFLRFHRALWPGRTFNVLFDSSFAIGCFEINSRYREHVVHPKIQPNKVNRQPPAVYSDDGACPYSIFTLCSCQRTFWCPKSRRCPIVRYPLLPTRGRSVRRRFVHSQRFSGLEID